MTNVELTVRGIDRAQAVRKLTAHERRILNVSSELDALCRQEDPEWCGWCDNLKAECCCHLDPSGLPAGHWSLEGK